MLLAGCAMLLAGGTGGATTHGDGNDGGAGGKCSAETNETMFFAMRFCTFLAWRPNRRDESVSLELDPEGDTLTMSTWGIGSRRL